MRVGLRLPSEPWSPSGGATSTQPRPAPVPGRTAGGRRENGAVGRWPGESEEPKVPWPAIDDFVQPVVGP